MSKVIIGIHGLGNKPPEKLLKEWWMRSICEGLVKIGYVGVSFKFELAYWADIINLEPLDPDVKDKNNSLFIENPYVPSTEYKKSSSKKFRKKVLDFIEKEMDKLFLNKDRSINFSAITDLIIKHYFKDFDIYYSSSCINKNKINIRAKDVIRARLADLIRKHRRKDIMLISHSMGTIIAYDVLTLITPDIKIDTWVTMGSPLGQPVVMSKILAEQQIESEKELVIKTPENINRHWFNLSDLDDKIAMNYNLADDYEENTKGIKPIDKEVYNNYAYKNKRNPHKSYGYLRTPELAQIIFEFLRKDYNFLTFWLRNYWQSILNKFEYKHFIR